MKHHPFQEQLLALDPVLRTGRVTGVSSVAIEADGPNVPLGSICKIYGVPEGSREAVHAEVVRVCRDRIVLSSLEPLASVQAGARVEAIGRVRHAGVGASFLGRAIDAMGRPIDGGEEIIASSWGLLHGEPTGPLDRETVRSALETGIRAIDGLLTFAKGQRVGIFAAGGVGKTSLMLQIAEQAKADVVIYGMVGERGREVEHLWHDGLSAAARARTTLVAATSDQPPAMRVRAANYALALAEYWRRQGKHVLLLLDSVTRLAMAMREIGLAAGEPPTVRAYTPGVFAALPRFVERCGALRTGGAVSAVMTVLSENDDTEDPLSEVMKSLLDGHILLSRVLAEQGHYPAIDVSRSISRLSDIVMSGEHRVNARKILRLISVHSQSRTLIEAGLYARGSNITLDRAIDSQAEIEKFLVQPTNENCALDKTCRMMAGLGRQRSS